MYMIASKLLIVVLLEIALPCTLGYGGIRRRAWGKVHMLRSGKRSDIAPGQESHQPPPTALMHRTLPAATEKETYSQAEAAGLVGPHSGSGYTDLLNDPYALYVVQSLAEPKASEMEETNAEEESEMSNA